MHGVGALDALVGSLMMLAHEIRLANPLKLKP